jgi:hypothetical protein
VKGIPKLVLTNAKLSENAVMELSKIYLKSLDLSNSCVTDNSLQAILKHSFGLEELIIGFFHSHFFLIPKKMSNP